MKIQKVAVIGANGQLGTDLVHELTIKYTINAGYAAKFCVFPLTHKEFELRDYTAVREKLTLLRPDVVINTAAYHKVDECEDNPEKAFQVNAIAVRNLAYVCRDLDIVLAHISTNYVFGGDTDRQSPYGENDPPWPVNVYGISKLASECFVRDLCSKYFVIRTAGLYGLAGSQENGGNFVELMLRLARREKPIHVVNDQRLTPTCTQDLARAVVELVASEQYGTYHLANAGDCTWYEFATSIFELTHLKVELLPISTEAFNARARRPAYAVLSCEQSFARTGLTVLRSWQDTLKAYIDVRGIDIS